MPIPRVALTWESIWHLPAPGDATERAMLADRRGRVVLSGYALYTDATTEREFDSFALPVIRNLAASRTRAILTLVESAITFDAARVRRALELARLLGVLSLVEIRGVWSSTLLELLAAAGPNYLRLAPDLVQGAAVMPEQFQTIVQIAEFARERRMLLVARNPGDGNELDAIRVGGIDLVQFGSIPIETHADGSLPNQSDYRNRKREVRR